MRYIDLFLSKQPITRGSRKEDTTSKNSSIACKAMRQLVLSPKMENTSPEPKYQVINGARRFVPDCKCDSKYEYANKSEYILVPRRMLEKEVRRVIEEVFVVGGVSIPDVSRRFMISLDADVATLAPEDVIASVDRQLQELKMRDISQEIATASSPHCPVM